MFPVSVVLEKLSPPTGSDFVFGLYANSEKGNYDVNRREDR